MRTMGETLEYIEGMQEAGLCDSEGAMFTDVDSMAEEFFSDLKKKVPRRKRTKDRRPKSTKANR